MAGSTMYDDLRSEMESTQRGRMIVIDVNTGDYEVGDNDVPTTPRLLERNLVGSYPGVSI